MLFFFYKLQFIKKTKQLFSSTSTSRKCMGVNGPCSCKASPLTPIHLREVDVELKNSPFPKRRWIDMHEGHPSLEFILHLYFPLMCFLALIPNSLLCPEAISFPCLALNPAPDTNPFLRQMSRSLFGTERSPRHKPIS